VKTATQAVAQKMVYVFLAALPETTSFVCFRSSSGLQCFTKGSVGDSSKYALLTVSGDCHETATCVARLNSSVWTKPFCWANGD
jgi:hypothetical protein